MVFASPADINGVSSGATPLTLVYAPGTVVSLITPVTVGAKFFSSWSGVDNPVGNTASVAMNTHRTVTAHYSDTPVSVTITSTDPNSAVSIVVSPADLNGAATGTTPFSRNYIPGTLLTLTAPQSIGQQQFLKWRKDGVDLSNTSQTQVTVQSNSTVTAVYCGPLAIVPSLANGVAGEYIPWHPGLPPKLPALADGVAGEPYHIELGTTGGCGTSAWTLVSGDLPPGVQIGTDADIPSFGRFQYQARSLELFWSGLNWCVPPVKGRPPHSYTLVRFPGREPRATWTSTSGCFRSPLSWWNYGAAYLSLTIISADGFTAVAYGFEDDWATQYWDPVQQKYLTEAFHVSGTYFPDFNVSPQTAFLNGIPSLAGVYTFRLRVTNESGASAEMDFTAKIFELPQIVSQPSSTQAVVHATATFSIVASGFPLNYQWERNGVPVPSGTNSTLAITNVGFSDHGNYRVSVFNSAGTVTSEVASLSVEANPPVVTEPTFLPNNRFYFMVFGLVGESYSIESTTNLTSGEWGSVAIRVITKSPMLVEIPNVSFAPQRFFRVRIQP